MVYELFETVELGISAIYNKQDQHRIGNFKLIYTVYIQNKVFIDLTLMYEYM